MLLYQGTKKLPETFTEEEINLILQQVMKCKDYWKTGHYKDWADWMRWRDMTLIATIYLLGTRPKEACKLKFSDFNFKTAIVKIRGENNKVRKDRVIPVPHSLLKFYKIYFSFPRARFWRGSKYLFPSFSNQFISAGRLKHIFREKVLKPLNLWNCPDKAKAQYRTIYKLRHSRASHILNKQIRKHGQPDLFMIASFLGHSDIRSTQVYLHKDEEYTEYMRDELNL